DAGGRGQRLVADELDGRDLGTEPLVDRRRLPLVAGGERRASAGALTLGLHLLGPRPLGGIAHHPAALAQHALGEVAREAVAVVEREQEAAVHRPPPSLALGDQIVVDPPHAAVERLREALLFPAHALLDA